MWKVAFGLAIFLLALVTANALIRPGHAISAKSLGHDFLAFYTAGSFVRDGRANDLYDLQKVHEFQRDLRAREGMEQSEASFPFWNPPFYSLAFAPLAKMSFFSAVRVWWIIGIACFAGAMVLLCRVLVHDTDGDWRRWGLLPLLAACSMPFIQSITHAQNSGMSLLLLTLIVMAWRRVSGVHLDAPSTADETVHRDAPYAYLTGALAALMFYKPQLGAILACVIVLHLGRRALAGLLASGTVLLGANILLLPGTLTDYMHRLPLNMNVFQVDQAYLWQRHVTIKAFWRLLLQGTEAGQMHWPATILTAACAIFLAAALVGAVLRCRKSVDADGLIAATIAATPLLMPFYFDYDLLLLAIPAVLMLRKRILDEDAVPRRLVPMLVALYVAAYFTPAVSSVIRLNLTVPALAMLAVSLIRHAYYSVEISAMWIAQAEPLTVRRAQAA